MIFAIDPGPQHSGWIIGDPLDKDNPVRDHEIDMNVDVLRRIENCGPYAQGGVVIEAFVPWNQRAGHDMVDTCIWIGRFMQAARHQLGVDPALLKRRDVCYYLTGNSQARKAAIRDFMVDRYGPGKEKAIGTKKRGMGPLYGLRVHEFDALALALVYAERLAKPVAGEET